MKFFFYPLQGFGLVNNAVNVLTHRYAKLGKTVHLKHLGSDCIDLLKNAEAIIDVNILEDPTYKVAVEKV